MTQEKFTPQESLSLIQSMIAKARQDISLKTHYYLVWGWLTFIACISQFILKNILEYERHYLVWLLMLAGAAYSVYMGRREDRSNRVKSYIGESMQQVWLGLGLAYVVLSFVLTRIGWGTNVFPFFIILYGLGTFISGRILKFRPLVIGGLLAWALACISVYLKYDYQMLTCAAAILVSYIIPAYMFRFKRSSDLSKSPV